mmetsp:Transcript_102788/g.154104  ORF Transcript_102788/g.154104 Transcript_102788/m.154104 type:complete len:109 (+) Transcript_102788:191-517(+)
MPRNVEKPTNEMSIGMNENARITKYGRAVCIAEDPSFRIDANALAGRKNMKLVPTTDIIRATMRAWQTASCVLSRSPSECAFDTSVAVTLGRNENNQKAELYTWFAAA